MASGLGELPDHLRFFYEVFIVFGALFLDCFSQTENSSLHGAGRGQKILLFQQNGVGFSANHDSPLRGMKWMNGMDEWMR